jgi:uncharacterized protein
MTYQRRTVDELLDELMPSLPAILLDGPKAVGKTTTALERAQTVRNLDLEAERARGVADPAWLVSGAAPILIDEWHRVPEVWSEVKRAVDANYAGGQFLLTGSMPDLGTHSGAGRISTIRMRPLSLSERNVTASPISFRKLLQGEAEIAGETSFTIEDYSRELMQSGFPAIRTLEGAALRRALDGYIERIIDADVPEMGLSVRKPASLRAWLTSYAAATATTASWEKIRDAANSGSKDAPAKTTVIPYRDALTRLRILDELPAWLPTRNQFVVASQSPKHFLADPALAMRLLNFDSESIQTAAGSGSAKQDTPLLGRLFEALATLGVRTYADASHSKVMHFRDAAGRREVDIIVERSDGRILPIEVKLGNTIHDRDLKHLKWLASELGEDLVDSVVLYSGSHAYRKDGIAIIPLAMLSA